MKKFFKRAAVGTAALSLAGAALWLSLPSWNDYRVDGTLRLHGLDAPVDVKRDEKGMAYAYAQSLDDALFAQGFLVAQDRFFNMHLVRLLAQGRLTELVGERALETDIRHRTVGLARLAAAHAAELEPRTRHLYGRYAAGVNAFLDATPEDLHLEFRLAGLEPEPWTVEDSLAVLYLMAWNNSANLKHEITDARLVEAVGEARAATLAPINVNPDEAVPAGAGHGETVSTESQAGPVTARFDAFSAGPDSRLDPWLRDAGLQNLLTDGALQVGSNNWASAPSRSAGGGAMLAGDPHLDPRLLPGVWYPIGLVWPGNRTVGANIPGLPGMGLGRTDYVALSMTNAYGDNQDLFIETLDPENPARYLEGETSLPFEIRREIFKIKDGNENREHVVEVRSTRRGPVVSGLLPGLEATPQRVVTLRWAVADPSMRDPESPFIALLDARTATDVDAAFDHLPSTVLNFVFADRDGHIGWRVSGRLPSRAPGTGTRPQIVDGGPDPWTGWIPYDAMPRRLDPAEGWVGTANHRTITDDYPFYYSNYFASSYRYARLKELFSGADDKLTVDDFWAWQRDVLNPMAQTVAPILAEHLRSAEDTRRLGDMLAAWDHQDRRDAAAPLVFQEVYRRLAFRLFEDELGRELTEAMLDNLYFWQERLQRLVVHGGPDAESWIDDVRTDAKENLRDMIVDAGRTADAELTRLQGADPTRWHWGRAHYLKLVHPLRRDGTGSDVLGTGPLPMGGSPETLYRGGYNSKEPYATSFAASLRWAVDFADGDKIRAVLPGGVAGRVFHPHYKDQVAAFMSGEPRWWWYSDTAIESHSRHHLRLEP